MSTAPTGEHEVVPHSLIENVQHSSRQRASPERDRAPALQAKVFLSSQLQATGSMEPIRHEVLKSALTFTNQLSLRPVTIESDAWENSIPCANMFPSWDTLHYITNGPVKSLGLSFFIDMGSLLSKASFEEQGLALLENRVHGATKSAYMVNVNYVAWAHLRATDFAGMSGPMSKHLIKRQDEYERNIIAALNHITVLDPQTFPLFQALLTGAMFMLLKGRIEQCWNLSTAASRTCLALSGKHLSDLASRDDESAAHEARYCFCLSYMFDKALSMSMDRLPSLPSTVPGMSLSVPNSPTKPFTVLLNVFIEFAKVQDYLVRNVKSQTVSIIRLKHIQELQGIMWQIRTTIQEQRSQEPHIGDAYLSGEWKGVDFSYYSIMTSVMRLHPRLADDAVLQDQLHGYARHSLHALTDMLVLSESIADLHTYRESVSWYAMD
ncbi:hypothetical protein E8E14_004419 [Neopestalotiopsis sp. 37M]|nr:hypothetical protein E8E14_004419 [Neopestalotiopsis sp. 37M]